MPTTTDTSLRIERSYAAPPEKVFEALTDPAILKQWFSPDPAMKVPTVEVDLREGGNYKIVMAGEQTHTVTGTFTEISRPDRLVYTWFWENDDTESIVTCELSESDGGTTLVLTHEKLASAESTERHEHGWNGCLNRLPEVL